MQSKSREEYRQRLRKPPTMCEVGSHTILQFFRIVSLDSVERRVATPCFARGKIISLSPDSRRGRKRGTAPARTVGQDPAVEVMLEFPARAGGQALHPAPAGSDIQERGQVIPDHSVENRFLRPATVVLLANHRGATARGVPRPTPPWETSRIPSARVTIRNDTLRRRTQIKPNEPCCNTAA